MFESQKPELPLPEIARWLATAHGQAIEQLVPLRGGFWSAAYSYRVGEDEFVLRLSNDGEGFAIDAAAMAFAGPALPIPEVIDRGAAFDLHYAISRRHHGFFLEDVSVAQADAAGVALGGLLAALRAVPKDLAQEVVWYDHEAAGTSWHQWLMNSLVDDPAKHVNGWRKQLAAEPRLDRLFDACELRIGELLAACPERTDLVHGDLLHQNVLLDDDARCVTAVFSWKCSARGDFLYDVAWCTLWSPWHPGIAAIDLWGQTLGAADLDEGDLVDAALRHHCYELQIAASHLAWNAWTGDERSLNELADATEAVLERGPLQMRT